ncbi:MAG: hypothetical protein K0Q66_2228 [Chitinophagaceae bacterium]|jgi:predicted NUDIX family NTP pyrophosphohydrolase|nr:hypothetical protein [Chitinophagaceae bacterium]
MSKQSAGILAYRFKSQQLQVLLVHPGGPFFTGKDTGVWSIPKGEFDPTEDALEVAKREFFEETGNKITAEYFIALEAVRIKSGKVIHAWAVEADFEKSFISSNLFEMEWPPKSGKSRSFPETDKAEWFTPRDAREKIHPGQSPLLDQLEALLKR